MKSWQRWGLGVLVIILLGGLSVYVGSLIPDGMLKKIENAGIILGYAFTIIPIGFALVAWFSKKQLRSFFHSNYFTGLGTPFPLGSKQIDGLLIPVSREEVPKWLLCHLRPKHVAFIYTVKTAEIVKKLIDEFSKDIKFYQIVSGSPSGEDVVDPYDLPGIKTMAAKWIRRLEAEGLSLDTIYADTTGGTVPMSLGVFQAAEESGISSIYVIGKHEGGRILKPEVSDEGKPILISDRGEGK
ncbi:MAG: hypothetical protein HZA20_10980 [Nitrospirae bacterium]|nr:hypothetical protein [Nitrospirota bacterium]